MFDCPSHPLKQRESGDTPLTNPHPQDLNLPPTTRGFFPHPTRCDEAREAAGPPRAANLPRPAEDPWRADPQSDGQRKDRTRGAEGREGPRARGRCPTPRNKGVDPPEGKIPRECKGPKRPRRCGGWEVRAQEATPGSQNRGRDRRCNAAVTREGRCPLQEALLRGTAPWARREPLGRAERSPATSRKEGAQKRTKAKTRGTLGGITKTASWHARHTVQRRRLQHIKPKGSTAP